MTWPFTAREGQLGATAASLVGDRTGKRLGRKANRDEALRHSAVWACLRLRADLISTMPADVFRRVLVDGRKVQIEQPKPPVLVAPGGKRVRWMEWMYSTQVDLDSTGNTAGLITEVNALGLPARVDLFNIDEVSFIGKGSEITEVRVGKEKYPYDQVWHEKQFTVSGCPVGLSPLAKAALSINAYLSAQEFASDWFGNYTMPGGHLKNTGKKLDKTDAQKAKANFKASVAAGDVWVSGSDWEYSMLSAKASESQFIEQQQFSVLDLCRFLGVPGDMIDAEVKGSSITYANVTQRNLQLLIMNIGPAIARREEALSAGLLPQPRYVKLNTNALLRMDLKSRYESYKVGVDSRFLPPSRVLELENMPPLTDEEIAEFATLFPNKAPAPSTGGNPA